MPRSPTDATRFTATGPHMAKPDFSSNPSSSPNPAPLGGTRSSPSHIQFGAPAPANETPQAKIARLRAAAEAARQVKESGFDRTVRVGRVWADRAHRFTAFSLMGLTVVCGAVATAGITDMLLHNRRRKKEWLADQQRKSAVQLGEAKQALAQGTVTEDQMLLINRERAALEADEAKRNRLGVFTRAKTWLFSGLSEEEQKGGRLGSTAATAATSATNALHKAERVVQQDVLNTGHDSGAKQVIHDTVEPHRRQVEKVVEVVRPLGGPLDQQAQSLANSAAILGNNWTSWLVGR